MKDRMYIEIDSKSCNESLARMVVAAFLTRLNPTVEEMEEVRSAVSEAVTNAIIHGYQGGKGIVYIECLLEQNVFQVIIRDEGIGIVNVSQAMKPLFTTKEDEERSGMGFSFMELFMDSLDVQSEPGKGTKITMTKIIGQTDKKTID